MGQGGGKDASPGAEGSTIPQKKGTATTISIYGASGNTLTEGSAMGLQIEEFTSSMIGVDNTTLAYAVKNPLSFVFNSISPNDWYVNSETYQNDALWGAGVNKSAYDPCPKRWRVPTDASLTYGDFSVNTMILSDLGINVATGRTYNSMAWFPSGGYRRSLYGTLGGVGGNGYYWSVSVNGTSAKYLNEGMSGVNPSAISNRAAGFSVRCVQE